MPPEPPRPAPSTAPGPAATVLLGPAEEAPPAFVEEYDESAFPADNPDAVASAEPEPDAAAPSSGRGPALWHGLRDRPGVIVSVIVGLLAVGGFLFALSLFSSTVSYSSAGAVQAPGSTPIASPTGPSAPPGASAPSGGPASASASAVPGTAGQVLREGDSGTRVRELQSRLHQIPGLYGAGDGETDGRYDSGVTQAVAHFQAAAWISGDASGAYGPLTRAALEARTQLPTSSAVARENDDEGEHHEDDSGDDE